MTEAEKIALRDLIISEITSHKHRSFQQLYTKANRVNGFDAYDQHSPYYRGVDNALQALKRRGAIEWFRFGTYKLWKLKEE